MNNFTNSPNSGKLIISRHTESEWNATGKWTGLTDVGLSKNGHEQAHAIGLLIADTPLDVVFTSKLKRTHETADDILEAANQAKVERIVSEALNERDYGDLTGKNKWQIKEEVGEETFNGIRRGWNHPVPGGETLKDVYERAIPYFDETILPRLNSGENVLIIAHGNTIRALRKHLENISDDDIADVEMPLGSVLIYQDGKLVEERKIEAGESLA